MNLISPSSLALAPVTGGFLFVAQAGVEVAEAVSNPTAFGILKLATETIVGVSVLFAVFMFLRRDKEKDDAIKQIADDFRSDVKTIAERFEENQLHLVERFEANQGELVKLTREVITTTVSHDSLLKALVDRQERIDERQKKIEMVVYAVHATAADPLAGPGPTTTSPAPQASAAGASPSGIPDSTPAE